MTLSSSADQDVTVATITNRRGSHVWHVISRDPLAMASIVIILIFLLVAIFGKIFTIYLPSGVLEYIGL